MVQYLNTRLNLVQGIQMWVWISMRKYWYLFLSAILNTYNYKYWKFISQLNPRFSRFAINLSHEPMLAAIHNCTPTINKLNKKYLNDGTLRLFQIIGTTYLMQRKYRLLWNSCTMLRLCQGELVISKLQFQSIFDVNSQVT